MLGWHLSGQRLRHHARLLLLLLLLGVRRHLNRLSLSLDLLLLHHLLDGLGLSLGLSLGLGLGLGLGLSLGLSVLLELHKLQPGLVHL